MTMAAPLGVVRCRPRGHDWSVGPAANGFVSTGGARRDGDRAMWKELRPGRRGPRSHPQT